VATPTLTFGTGRRYDTKYLMDGTVRVEGFDIAYPDRGVTPGLFFPDMVSNQPFDVGELAFSHYLIAKDQGKPITAIPAFPSRFFPHLGVSVHKAAGIATPRDLVDKRVASPDWGYNPAVWMRGILAHQYEVPIERITWIESAARPTLHGVEYPRSRRFQVEQVQVPAGLEYHRPESYGIRAVLEAHAVDAVFLPSGGMPPTANTQKLFPDPYPEIRAYVEQTGVFPINTVIVLKDATIHQYPELPARLMAALEQAMQLYRGEVARGEVPAHMDLDVEKLRDLGVLSLEYGIAPNRPAIRMMIHYCYEQGLIRRLYDPEELFEETVR